MALAEGIWFEFSGVEIFVRIREGGRWEANWRQAGEAQRRRGGEGERRRWRGALRAV